MGWSLSRVLWALCRRSPWRPLVASGGSEPPAGDTVRTGGGRSGTVRVQCGCLPVLPYRFGRPGRRLGPAAVAANSLPVPFSARGNRREARSGGGTGRHTSTVSAKVSRSSPAARNVPGRTWVAFGRLVPFRFLFRPSTVVPGRGGRRDRRDAAVREAGGSGSCTLRRAALSCADRELAQGVPNIENVYFQHVNIFRGNVQTPFVQHDAHQLCTNGLHVCKSKTPAIPAASRAAHRMQSECIALSARATCIRHWHEGMHGLMSSPPIGHAVSAHAIPPAVPPPPPRRNARSRKGNRSPSGLGNSRPCRAEPVWID